MRVPGFEGNPLRVRIGFFPNHFGILRCRLILGLVAATAMWTSAQQGTAGAAGAATDVPPPALSQMPSSGFPPAPISVPAPVPPVLAPPAVARPSEAPMGHPLRRPGPTDVRVEAKYDVSRIGDRGVGGGLDFYSLEREQALGRELAQEVEASSRLVTDPRVTEYVNRVGQNIVRNSDARVPFTIKVIDDDEVNAFALPGGFFYVDSGLILAADNEAELAGVMAHEIAHVAARHATKNATREQLLNLATIPMIFVGGPLGYAVRQIAGLALPMSFLKFSRDAEREADLLGLEYEYGGRLRSRGVRQVLREAEAGRQAEAFVHCQGLCNPSDDGRADCAGRGRDRDLPAAAQPVRRGHQRIPGDEGAPGRHPKRAPDRRGPCATPHTAATQFRFRERYFHRRRAPHPEAETTAVNNWHSRGRLCHTAVTAPNVTHITHSPAMHY